MTALHERLRFDTANGQVLDADRRYVLMRADVLMGMFAALPEAAREEALQALGHSVASHGADSVRAYAAEVGAAALCASMEAAAASLGWGRWRLLPAAVDTVPRSLSLDVENSPFAAAAAPSGAPVCHAIAGMLEALAAVLWNEPASGRETRCAAQRGDGRCHFTATAGRAERPP